MRNKIKDHYPSSKIVSSSGKKLYIADFSNRTKNERGVELHEEKPMCPKNPESEMDCVEIVNDYKIEIDFHAFCDDQFKDRAGNDIEHCECCLYPTDNEDSSWIMMLEIKDCKPSKISEYRNKAISQIVSVTKIFRSQKIITKHKVHGIISMPKRKVAFDHTIFGMPSDYMNLQRKYGIHFAATNHISIERTKIKPCHR